MAMRLLKSVCRICRDGTCVGLFLVFVAGVTGAASVPYDADLLSRGLEWQGYDAESADGWERISIRNTVVRHEQGKYLTITYDGLAAVSLSSGDKVYVYNIAAELVRTIPWNFEYRYRVFIGGEHYPSYWYRDVFTAVWDGTNDSGERVTTGVYFLTSWLFGDQEFFKVAVINE